MENSIAEAPAIWYNCHILLFSTWQGFYFCWKRIPALFILRNTKQFDIKTWYICDIEIDISRPILKHKMQVILVCFSFLLGEHLVHNKYYRMFS